MMVPVTLDLASRSFGVVMLIVASVVVPQARVAAAHPCTSCVVQPGSARSMEPPKPASRLETVRVSVTSAAARAARVRAVVKRMVVVYLPSSFVF